MKIMNKDKYKETLNTVMEKFYNGEIEFQDVVKFEELQKKAEEEEAEKPLNMILGTLKEIGEIILFLWAISAAVTLGLAPIFMIFKALGIQ